jgi:DNA-binding MarR family transcriptional regulator
MPASTHDASSDRALLRALAAFRYQLRIFLHFSEEAAHDAGLQPQQHQLLLQIAGIAEGEEATVAYAAERLGLRHNSTVELVDRSVAQGLLLRAEDPGNRRRILLRITPHGEEVLRQLSAFHAHELHDLAPELLRSIRGIGRMQAVTRARQRELQTAKPQTRHEPRA